MRYMRRPPTLACIMEEDRSTHTAATASVDPSRSDDTSRRPDVTASDLPILTNQELTAARPLLPAFSNTTSYLGHLLASKTVVDSTIGCTDTRLDGNETNGNLIPTLPNSASRVGTLPLSISPVPFRPDARTDRISGNCVRVSSIRHKLSKNHIVRHFLSERGSFILKSTTICDSCDHDKRKKSSANRPLRMCPLCRSHLPLVGDGARDPFFLPPIKQRSGQSLSLGNAIRTVCAAGRRFYSVWTTILVIWVIALVLICDFQSYSSSSTTVRTTAHPPKAGVASAMMPGSAVAFEPPPQKGSGKFAGNMVMIHEAKTRKAFRLVSLASVSELGVSLATNGLAGKEVATTAPLHVQVFYEPLCPDSRHFVRYQLKNAIEQLGEHIDLQMVPYGKATTTEENGELSFQCQHGPTECLANKIHSCVVREVKDQAQQLKLIDCMIADNYKPKSIAQKCVTQVLGSGHWAPIQLCYTSRNGDQALKHMGSLTNSLDPPVSFIPTITIDQSQDDQKHMLQDFTKVLCKRFKGTPPPACS